MTLTPAPPTPTEVTAQPMSVSSIRLAWQWTRSGPAPNCFNTTRVTYHFEGGGESSLQLSDPAATEVTLTNLRNKPCVTITVVATAGEHRREGGAFLPLQGILYCQKRARRFIWSHSAFHYRSKEPISSCAGSYFSPLDLGGSLPHTAVPHPLQGSMWGLC